LSHLFGNCIFIKKEKSCPGKNNPGKNSILPVSKQGRNLFVVYVWKYVPEILLIGCMIIKRLLKMLFDGFDPNWWEMI